MGYGVIGVIIAAGVLAGCSGQEARRVAEEQARFEEAVSAFNAAADALQHVANEEADLTPIKAAQAGKRVSRATSALIAARTGDDAFDNAATRVKAQAEGFVSGSARIYRREELIGQLRDFVDVVDTFRDEDFSTKAK